MKKIIVLITAMFLLSVSASAAPTLLKRTIEVTPKRFLRYWKNPKAAEPVYNTYSWIPQVQFDVLGPIEGGEKLYVEFDAPDGKPWMKVNMRTPEIGDDIWETIKADGVDDSELEKQAILGEGVFSFRIKMKNPLNGTDKVLFSGKFKVGTYALDQQIPEYKEKRIFSSITTGICRWLICGSIRNRTKMSRSSRRRFACAAKWIRRNSKPIFSITENRSPNKLQAQIRENKCSLPLRMNRVIAGRFGNFRFRPCADLTKARATAIYQLIFSSTKIRANMKSRSCATISFRVRSNLRSAKTAKSWITMSQNRRPSAACE
jgi:hypothetical protein